MDDIKKLSGIFPDGKLLVSLLLSGVGDVPWIIESVYHETNLLKTFRKTGLRKKTKDKSKKTKG